MDNSYIRNRIASLVNAVIRHEQNASLDFFFNLPMITKAFSTSESKFIELILFINSWCNFGDGFAVRVLVNHFSLLIPSNSDVLLLQSFLSVLISVIEDMGTYILPQLLIFAPQFLENVGSDFINALVFPSLAHLYESQIDDVGACAFQFLASLAPKLSKEKIDSLIFNLHRFVESNIPALQLVAVRTVHNLLPFSSSPQDLYNQFITSSLKSSSSIVKCNAIKETANKFQNSIEDILEFTSGTNWFLKVAFIDNCMKFIKESSDVEAAVYKLAKDPNVEIRTRAIIKISKHLSRISDQQQICSIIDAALRQRSERILLAGCQLLFKTQKKFPTSNFVNYIQILKDSKSISVKIWILRVVVPVSTITRSDEAIIHTWIKAILRDHDWRHVAGLLDAIASFLHNDSTIELAKTYISEFTNRIEDPNASIRLCCANNLIEYLKICGWDFARNHVFPKVLVPMKSNKMPLMQTAVQFFIGAQSIDPPDDIIEIIESCIALVPIENRIIPSIDR